MTKAEFERAKQLEKEIEKAKYSLENLKGLVSGMYLSSLNVRDCVNVPNSCKMAIYKQVKEALEKELAEMEREFSELVSE